MEFLKLHYRSSRIGPFSPFSVAGVQKGGGVPLGNEIYNQPISSTVKQTIDKLVKSQNKPGGRELGHKYFYYYQELIKPLINLTNNIQYILIAIYQIIEMYESLIAFGTHVKVNFGHHDLHLGNIGFVYDENKIFSAKLLDFGMSYYHSQHFQKNNYDNKHLLQLTIEQRAAIDVLHMLASISIYVDKVSGSLIHSIVSKYSFLKVNQTRNHSSIHDDFSWFHPNRYLAVTKYRYQDQVNFDELKSLLRHELTSKFNVKWTDIEHPTAPSPSPSPSLKNIVQLPQPPSLLGTVSKSTKPKLYPPSLIKTTPPPKIYKPHIIPGVPNPKINFSKLFPDQGIGADFTVGTGFAVGGAGFATGGTGFASGAVSRKPIHPKQYPIELIANIPLAVAVHKESLKFTTIVTYEYPDCDLGPSVDDTVDDNLPPMVYNLRTIELKNGEVIRFRVGLPIFNQNNSKANKQIDKPTQMRCRALDSEQIQCYNHTMQSYTRCLFHQDKTVYLDSVSYDAKLPNMRPFLYYDINYFSGNPPPSIISNMNGINYRGYLCLNSQKISGELICNNGNVIYLDKYNIVFIKCYSNFLKRNVVMQYDPTYINLPIVGVPPFH